MVWWFHLVVKNDMRRHWLTVFPVIRLVLKERPEEAIRSLNFVRPQRDIDSGLTTAEVNAFEKSLQEAGGHDQGRWTDLFRGNMLRRTWIAWSLFVFLQFAGVQFINRSVA